LRNVGIVAHIDAGKTTVSERLLYFSGVEHRLGEVDEGTAVMDWMAEERERGITIVAAATQIPWRSARINLIDTPGHIDFGIEVERCLRVLDGGVLVLDAVAGVQAQTETVWRQIAGYRVPALCFVNKCDRPGAHFLAAVGSLEARLGVRAVPIAYPWYREGRLAGVVDLLEPQLLIFPEPRPGAPPPKPERLSLPADVADECLVLRSELADRLGVPDTSPRAALLAPLRRATLAGELVPALCGAALRGIGIQPLLDGIVDLLPSPEELPPLAGVDPATGAPVERHRSESAPLAALVFKLQAEEHGDLAWMRVYAGGFRAGEAVFHPRSGRMERIQRIVRMHAQTRTAVESVSAGDIVAVIGCKHCRTGDTLCARDAPLLLEALEIPAPVIALVVEPRATAQREKLRLALGRLTREDPTLQAKEDESTGQWLIQGMGELHLEVAVHRLEREHALALSTGKPRVAFREAAREAGAGASTIERHLGGKDVFGSVELFLRPAAPADARGLRPVRVEFAPDCGVPEAMRAVVAQALVDGSRTGPRFGFPLADTDLLVTGGASRSGHDSEVAFAQAAAQALRQAQSGLAVDVLEPLMRLEVATPSEFTSPIVADLRSRGANIESIDASGPQTRIVGRVPLAEMFGYSTAVRSHSQGRASFSLQPAGFQRVREEDLAARGLSWS
jgi:elongation factor G